MTLMNHIGVFLTILLVSTLHVLTELETDEYTPLPIFIGTVMLASLFFAIFEVAFWIITIFFIWN